MSSRLSAVLIAALGSALLAACAPEAQMTSTGADAGAVADTSAFAGGTIDGARLPTERAAIAAGAAMASSPAGHGGQAIAAWPDRGDLVGYDHVRRVQRQGAHTFHPVQVSEAHALAAIGTGTLTLTAPDQRRIQLRYERHVEHANGDWSWIGRDEDGVDAILTFGEQAVFGVLPDGSDGTLRLMTSAGQTWMATTDKGVLSPLERRIRDGVAPPDYKVPPRDPLDDGAQATAPGTVAASKASVGATRLDASPTAAGTTIDLLLGYTTGFASMMGGSAQAQTRLNHLVAVGNQAFRNSSVDVELRLVGTLQVNYPDSGSNETALEHVTGSSGSADVTVPASLQPLRNARDALGADLVSLVRRFRDADHEGCGIAWLIGGGQTPIVAGHERFGYSTISDSNGMLAPDNGHYCRDETLIHELGHNLGSQHDVETARGDDGVVDAEDYGRYSYSFGLKTSATNGNFFTVMAYGDGGQTAYRVFSNPQITSCGGRACGITNQADNARSLRGTTPLIADFRASIGGVGRVAGINDIGGDFNGDGVDDLLWRHLASGHNRIWLRANHTTQQPIGAVGDVGWIVAGVGDFTGDGVSDIVWRHQRSGQNRLWVSANVNASQVLAGVPDSDWQVVGVGDFDGDGRADLLWRHAQSGANRIWRSGNAASQLPITGLDLSWQVAAVGDFTGDGRADVVWRNSGSGHGRIWPGGNHVNRLTIVTVADQDWQVAASGDFNGDGRADLFWRHAVNGENQIWYSADYGTRAFAGLITDEGWAVAASGDFNGDGRSDVVWRNGTTGANTLWPSGNPAGFVSLAPVNDLRWRIVP